MDIIRIHRLELDCIVGIRPQEREQHQRVRIDLGLHTDVSRAGRSGRISLTVDYDQVAHEVAALLSFRRYHLVEMAAEEVSAMLLGVHPGVERVEVRIEKPRALEGRARAASVEVRRTRQDYPLAEEQSAEARREVLLDTREARLELLWIAPGRSARGEPGFSGQGLSWLVSGQLDGPTGPLALQFPEAASQACSGSLALLRNPGPDPACLFRCWRRSLSGH